MSLSVGAGADVDPEPEDDPGQGQQSATVKARLTHSAQTQSTPSLGLRPGHSLTVSVSGQVSVSVATPGCKHCSPRPETASTSEALFRTFEELWSDLATRVTL